MSDAEDSRLRRIAIGRNPRVTVIRIGILIAVCLVIFRFVLLPVRIDGISMYPTFRDGSIHVINRLAYLHHGPERGDVVGIRLRRGTNDGPQVPSVMFMKRIIGLPGETLNFVNGQARINGAALPEPYLKESSDWDSRPIQMGPDQYFVVGDNRSMPWEFHTKGKVTRAQIMGKVVF